jgi:hypothetical protein
MKIEPAVNPYYLQVLEDIQNILKSSTPGKRIWTLDEVTGSPNYSQTQRSTFPHWSKFWYVNTPRKERINYILEDRQPYEDGYYNGNTRDLLRVLENSKSGCVSKRTRTLTAWDNVIQGFLADVKDWEYENQSEYYDYESLKDFPF